MIKDAYFLLHTSARQINHASRVSFLLIRANLFAFLMLNVNSFDVRMAHVSLKLKTVLPFKNVFLRAQMMADVCMINQNVIYARKEARSDV